MHHPNQSTKGSHSPPAAPELRDAGLTGRPAECQRTHLILTPHGSETHARFVIDSIRSILRPELKGLVTVIVWHELGVPVDAPAYFQDLAPKYDKVQRERIKSLPKFDWDREFSLPELRPPVLAALTRAFEFWQKRSNHLMRDQLSGGPMTVTSASGENFDSYLTECRALKAAGWSVENCFEQPPLTSVIEKLRSSRCIIQSGAPLLAGDPDTVLSYWARSKAHFEQSSALRDRALCGALAAGQRSSRAEIHLVVRGGGHESGMRAGCAELQLECAAYVNTANDRWSSEATRYNHWRDVVQSGAPLDNVRAILAQDLFLDVGEKLLARRDIGFNRGDLVLFGDLVKVHEPDAFLGWLDSTVRSRTQTLTQLIARSFEWLGDRTPPSSLPDWDRFMGRLRENRFLV